MSKYTPFQLFIRQALLYPLLSPFLPGIADVKFGVSYANGQLTGTLAGGAQKYYPADQVLTDNGDGTISDNVTGLMWAKDANGAGCYSGGKRSQNAAVTWANALVFAGHDDWRMPTIIELQTILDYAVTPPSIKSCFTNSKNEAYWTSTLYQPDSGFGWIVDFTDGTVFAIEKFNSYYVRAVRKII